MASQAHNFAYQMAKVWEHGPKSRAWNENALDNAERLGAKIKAKVQSLDHWINKPGDELGYLMEWPDGSKYIVGQNGHWIHACRVVGRSQPLYKEC